jgi:hypothetical protein
MRREDRYVVLNFSIDVLRKRIYRLLGCYGPEEDFPIDMFDEVIRWTVRHVREWRLYPDLAA